MFEQSTNQIVIFLDFHSTKQGRHWLILGHVALTKIKCIPIVIHLMYPARDTLQHVIKAWWKVV